MDNLDKSFGKNQISLEDIFSYKKSFTDIANGLEASYKEKDIEEFLTITTQFADVVGDFYKKRRGIEKILIQQVENYSQTTHDMDVVDINVQAVEIIHGLTQLSLDMEESVVPLLKEKMDELTLDNLVAKSARSEIHLETYVSEELYRQLYLKSHEFGGRLFMLDMILELGHQSSVIDPEEVVSFKEADKILIKKIEAVLQKLVPTIRSYFKVPPDLDLQPNLFTSMDASDANLIFDTDIFFAKGVQDFSVNCRTTYDPLNGKIMNIELSEEEKWDERISLRTLTGK